MLVLTEPLHTCSLTLPAASSGFGSPLLPGWAKRMPDPPATANEIEAAIRGIISGPVLFKDFVAPAPGPVATDEDHLAAIKSLAAHYQAISPSVPLSGWSPSPAPLSAEAAADATSSQPAPLDTDIPTVPAEVPPAVTRPPSPAASGSAITATPGPAHGEAGLTAGLAQLHSVYPVYSEDFLLAALERHEYDPAAALGWLVSVNDIDVLVAAMADAFPSAPKRTINRLVQECGGDLSAVWSTLSQSHASAWTDQFSASAIQRKSSRSRLLVTDDESDVSDVMTVSDDLRRFESSWWTLVHHGRRFRVGTGSPHLPSWDSICAIACTSAPVSPRFAGHVFSLGLRTKDTRAFKEAVTVLRSLPSYKSICESLAGLHPAATPIVRILVEDGLSSPGAALWLALNSDTDNSVFTGFVRAHLSICKKRNKALHAAKLADHPSAAHAQQVIDDSDLASEIDVDVVPDHTAAFQDDWDMSVAPSVVNRPKKPKKVTGTRSSTRGAAKRASDKISNLSHVSAGTLDFFVTPVGGPTPAGPSRPHSEKKTVRRSRSGPVKLKKSLPSRSSPFQGS